MSDLRISMAQARHNMEILDVPYVTFTADESGNLDYISSFNLVGLLVNWITNLINGSEEHKVNKAVLATFQSIKQHAASNPINPTWTYPTEDGLGKDYDIGFDKVAMKVLLNWWRFPACYKNSPEKESDDILIRIRKDAYDVMVWATQQRTRCRIEFDCDHLSSPERFKRLLTDSVSSLF